MHNTYQTPNFDFTYSENQVDSRTNDHILWENHCHARYEMIAVLEGAVNVMLEGRDHRIKEGQVIILPPLCYHAITANQTGTYKRITAFFDLSSVPSVIQEKFTQGDTSPTICGIPQVDTLRRLFQGGINSGDIPLLESLMICLFYERMNAPIATGDGVDTKRLIRQMILYIDEHLCEKIVLDDLAKHTARSKSFVCHLFEEEMGIPPRQYILQKRMAYAQKRIREGHSATLVAAELGYQSYATFYRMYQKHCRENPLKSKPKRRE